MEVKVACMARLIAAVPSINANNTISDAPIVALLAEEDFSKQIAELLSTTADHYRVTRSMIDVLATSMPELGLKIASSLNVEPRRDRAKSELVEAILRQSLTSIPFDFAFEILESIVNPEIAGGVIKAVLARVEQAEDEPLRRNSKSILPFLAKACDIDEVIVRCNACSSAVVILSRIADPALAGLLEKVLHDLRSSWSSMDEGTAKVDLAFTLAGTLAVLQRDEAQFYLAKGQELKDDPQLDSGRSTYVSTVRLAIRAYSGLLFHQLETESNLEDISGSINRIPSLQIRVRLWTEIALGYARASRRDNCAKIVAERIRPLLEVFKKQEMSGWRKAVVTASPALYQAHSPTTIALLRELTPEERDVGLHFIITFILWRVPRGEPFENKDEKSNLDYLSAIDICSLLDLAESDTLVYVHVRHLVQSAIWRHKKTPFTQEQRNELARCLDTLITAKLPNARFIAHQGFSIVARAEVLRLLRHTADKQWETLIEEAKLVPNLCDKVLVLSLLAETLPKELLHRKNSLLNEARGLADSIPSLMDRVERMRSLAQYAIDVDKSLAKRFVKEAIGLLSNSDTSDTATARRELVDLLYRIDPDAAAALASTLDTDEARRVVRDRVKFNELRDKLIKSDDAAAQSPDTHFSEFAQAGWIILGQLNANRVKSRHIKETRQWLKTASGKPLGEAYPIFALVIENAVSRTSKAPGAAMVMRELFDSSILSCNLLAGLVSRYRFNSKIHLVVDSPERIPLREGDRDKAIEFFRNWIATHTDAYLYICDPHFGRRDLEILSLVQTAAPSIKVTILTSKKQQVADGITGDYANAYLEYWHEHFSDQPPPSTDLVIVGVQRTGVLPIHDRWCISKNSGLRLGGSFNGLGVSRFTEISLLSDEEVEDRRNETEQYLHRVKREHMGEKLDFIFVTL